MNISKIENKFPVGQFLIEEENLLLRFTKNTEYYLKNAFRIILPFQTYEKKSFLCYRYLSMSFYFEAMITSGSFPY